MRTARDGHVPFLYDAWHLILFTIFYDRNVFSFVCVLKLRGFFQRSDIGAGQKVFHCVCASELEKNGRIPMTCERTSEC